MSKTQKSFISGAAILAAGSLIAKFLGMFFKIPVTNILGEYGYGLYGYAYPIYNACLAISTTGLPIAVSKMVAEKMTSEDYFSAYRVFGVSIKAITILGALISAGMFLSADLMIKICGWPQDAYYSIVSLSIAPLFVSMVSTYRGFFQGMQKMAYPSISQVFDQIGRVGFGLFLAYTLTKSYGVALGAAGATFGAAAGSIFSLVFLSVSFMRMKKSHQPLINMTRAGRKAEDAKVILKGIVMMAVPVILGSFVNNIMDLVNGATIPNIFATLGYTAKETTSVFGLLESANTLTNVPLVIGSSLSASIVPFISRAIANGEGGEIIKKQTALALRTSFYVALPCAIGLSVLALPIFELIFPKLLGGADLMKYSALVVIFTISGSNLQAILQGSGYFYKALSTVAISAVIKVVMNVLLVRIPELNIYGAILATMISTVSLFVMNLYMVNKYVGIGKCAGSILKTVLSAVIMGIFAKYSYSLVSSFLGGKIGVLVAIALSAVVYAGLLLITKAVTKEDIKEIIG